MGGRCRLGGREMTWFWGASSSPQGVPAERGPNPANPLSAHTQKHHTKMCVATCTYVQYIRISTHEILHTHKATLSIYSKVVKVKRVLTDSRAAERRDTHFYHLSI